MALSADQEPAEVADEQFSAAISALTSAFGDPTRREIYLHVRASPGATASEVALAFGLHPNVARHHLDRLAAAGYLSVSLQRPPAGAGRPSKHYRALLSPGSYGALDLLARRDELVVSLLVAALDHLGPSEAEALAEQVGVSYGQALAERMSPGEGQRSLRAAMHVVADALTAHGFAARAEHHGTSTAVVSENCPFGPLAAEHPVICAVDKGMVRGLLSVLCTGIDTGDGGVQVLLKSRARGDDSCTATA